MQKIYLDELPRKIYNKRCCIDWHKSIGHKCLFVYEDIQDEVEILDYNKKDIKLNIKIDGYCDNFKINVDSFTKAMFGVALSLITNKFKVKIDSNFKDDKRDITVLDREYRKNSRGNNKKWYKYKCNICGWTEGWMEESHLLSGIGCSCCRGLTPVEGINTIVDTHPYLVKYFQGGTEEAKLYTKGSNHCLFFKCPYCKKIKENAIGIYKLCNRGFSCDICSDGKSYPEKYIYNLLTQLNIKFKPEKVFSWSNRKQYDVYLIDYNCIIETHGLQHYEEGFGRTIKSARDLIEEQENDRYKYELANKNNIDNYISIDCRYSEMEWIRNSVMNSELPSLLGFKKEDIDWMKCHEFALSSFVKEICEYKKNSPEMTSLEIGEHFKMNRGTILKYLKQGAKIGWCDYNAEEEMNKARSKSVNNNKFVEIFKDDISLGVFKSVKELSKQSIILFGMKLNISNIYSVCRGKTNHYKGFVFKYV